MERAAEVFKKGPSTAEKELKEKEERIARLERKVGQLTYEVDWLKKKSEDCRTRLGEKISLIEMTRISASSVRQNY